MSRKEFTKATQNAAWERSGEICEALGELYGLAPGVRCTNNLNLGVEYDHVDMDANSKDNSLENCAAVCPKCHRWKTDHVDIPKGAKTVAQQEKHRNIVAPSRKRSAFPKRVDPWGKHRTKSFKDIHEDNSHDG